MRRHYNIDVVVTCSPGLMFLIVSEFLTGLFFTGLVLVVAGSWKGFVGRWVNQGQRVVNQL